MTMTPKERIDAFITYKGLKRAVFERECGFSNGYTRNLKGSPSVSKVEDILKVYPEINRDWLLTGEGNMIKEAPADTGTEQTKEDDVNQVLLLPISAQGGSLTGFSDSVNEWDCERIISPVKGADFAITIAGDSMSPEYPAGSVVLIKKIYERAFINWGHTFVLDTCNGTILKKLYPTDDPNIISCRSVNPEYPPFEVNLEDVYGVYSVLMCMSRK